MPPGIGLTGYTERRPVRPRKLLKVEPLPAELPHHMQDLMHRARDITLTRVLAKFPDTFYRGVHILPARKQLPEHDQGLVNGGLRWIGPMSLGYQSENKFLSASFSREAPDRPETSCL